MLNLPWPPLKELLPKSARDPGNGGKAGSVLFCNENGNDSPYPVFCQTASPPLPAELKQGETTTEVKSKGLGTRQCEAIGVQLSEGTALEPRIQGRG